MPCAPSIFHSKRYLIAEIEKAAGFLREATQVSTLERMFLH
jgi:hypothetical protein